MKTKAIVCLLILFMVFNSCKKTAQLFVKVKQSGKVYIGNSAVTKSGVKIFVGRITRQNYLEQMNKRIFRAYSLFVIDSCISDENGNYELNYRKDRRFYYYTFFGIGNSKFFYQKTITTTNYLETNIIENINLYKRIPTKYEIENPNRYLIYYFDFDEVKVLINDRKDRFTYIFPDLAGRRSSDTYFSANSCNFFYYSSLENQLSINKYDCKTAIENDTLIYRYSL